MPRPPVPLSAAVGALALLGAAGCGGDGTRTVSAVSTQTVVRTVTAPTTSTASTAATTPTATTPIVPAGPHRCGRIDVSYPNGEGGSSALDIVATGLTCGEARAVTRACQRGNVTPGWRATVRGNGHALMTSGSRRITFGIAGGGGCFSG